MAPRRGCSDVLVKGKVVELDRPVGVGFLAGWLDVEVVEVPDEPSGVGFWAGWLDESVGTV